MKWGAKNERRSFKLKETLYSIKKSFREINQLQLFRRSAWKRNPRREELIN